MKPQTVQLLCVARRLSHFHMNWKVITSDMLAVGHVGRILNSLHQSTSPGALAKPSYILRRANLIAADRGKHSIREGCYHQSGKSSSSCEFLVNPFFIP